MKMCTMECPNQLPLLGGANFLSSEHMQITANFELTAELHENLLHGVSKSTSARAGADLHEIQLHGGDKSTWSLWGSL